MDWRVLPSPVIDDAVLQSPPAAAVQSQPVDVASTTITTPDGDESVAIFAGGCFWCMEPPFDKLSGVLSTTSGYTGGRTPNPFKDDVAIRIEPDGSGSRMGQSDVGKNARRIRAYALALGSRPAGG